MKKSILKSLLILAGFVTVSNSAFAIVGDTGTNNYFTIVNDTSEDLLAYSITTVTEFNFRCLVPINDPKYNSPAFRTEMVKDDLNNDMFGVQEFTVPKNSAVRYAVKAECNNPEMTDVFGITTDKTLDLTKTSIAVIGNLKKDDALNQIEFNIDNFADESFLMTRIVETNTSDASSFLKISQRSSKQ